MVSVGVRELREHMSKLLERVRTQGEVIEITLHGETVARLVPVHPPAAAEGELEGKMAALWADIDQLAAEIGANWPQGISAVDAVRETRREL